MHSDAAHQICLESDCHAGLTSRVILRAQQLHQVCAEPGLPPTEHFRPEHESCHCSITQEQHQPHEHPQLSMKPSPGTQPDNPMLNSSFKWHSYYFLPLTREAYELKCILNTQYNETYEPESTWESQNSSPSAYFQWNKGHVKPVDCSLKRCVWRRVTCETGLEGGRLVPPGVWEKLWWREQSCWRWGGTVVLLWEGTCWNTKLGLV